MVRALFPAHRHGLSSECERGEYKSSLVSLLIKTLILLDQAPPFRPHLTFITFLEALSPTTVTQGLGLQHMNGEGDRNTQPMTKGLARKKGERHSDERRVKVESEQHFWNTAWLNLVLYIP